MIQSVIGTRVKFVQVIFARYSSGRTVNRKNGGSVSRTGKTIEERRRRHRGEERSFEWSFMMED